MGSGDGAERLGGGWCWCFCMVRVHGGALDVRVSSTLVAHVVVIGQLILFLRKLHYVARSRDDGLGVFFPCEYRLNVGTSVRTESGSKAT